MTQQYTITTFDVFTQFTQIVNVIITRKKTKQGYIKFTDGCWHRLYNQNNKRYFKNEKYLFNSLSNIDYYDLLYYNWKHYGYINIKDGSVISAFDYFIKLQFLPDLDEEYELIEIIFDYDAIEKDIVETKYSKYCATRDLLYCEFPMKIKNPSNVIKILNCETGEMYNMDYYDKKDEILYKYTLPIHIFHTRPISNTKVVDKLMSAISIHQDKIAEYKDFCRNIFVEPNTGDTKIFFDCCGKYNYFAYWLIEAVLALTSKIVLTSDDYFIRLIKIKSKYCNRLAIIKKNDELSDISLSRMIKEFENIGIKNIMICHRDKNHNIYNEDSFVAYYEKHKELLFNYCYKKSIDDMPEDPHDIFVEKDGMFMNYLAWCCK